jgi:hypothetical protein
VTARVYCTGMNRWWVAGALAVLLGLPVTAAAQAPSGGDSKPLQLRRDAAPPRPVVRPDSGGDQAARDAERAAAEYERRQRDDAVIREQSRPAVPRRPELGYDVYGGIQQRNIPRR